MLNENFISNIKEIYGEVGLCWLNELSNQISEICNNWNLRFIHPMPKLTYNFVCLVEQKSSGCEAILKLAPTNQQLAIEAQCLSSFGQGAAKVYRYDHHQHALLVEKLSPGQSLTNRVLQDDDDAATRIISQIIRDLQSQQTPHTFRHIAELSSSLTLLHGRIEAALLSKAESLFKDLTSDHTHDVVLHGDLHHDNILANGKTWLAIDPHGYTGDPVFEVGSMIFNPYDFLSQKQERKSIIRRRLQILAEELPFDLPRIKAWAFCRTILSVAWAYEDHGIIDDVKLEIAGLL